MWEMGDSAEVHTFYYHDFFTTIILINDIKLPRSLDIDECDRGTDNCDLNANCVNTQGSFECMCREGYEGNGRMCTGIYRAVLPALNLGIPLRELFLNADINECFRDSDDCSDFARCFNTQGSFTCTCLRGYRGDGRVCNGEHRLAIESILFVISWTSYLQISMSVL